MDLSIEKLLSRYESSGLRLNPSAIDEEISAMQAALRCELPLPIVSLYRHHNGEDPSAPVKPFRLMSASEVIEFHTPADDRVDFAVSEHGVRVFWADDITGDYAGVYVEGPLAGAVCVVAFEETDFTPRYHNVTSFLEVILDALPEELDWQDLKTDYPEVSASSDPNFTKHHKAAVSELKKLASRENDARRRAELEQIIVSITPRAHADLILSYTYSEDMWVQERACNILGQMKYEPAIDRLAEVAVSGTHNGKLAAITALGRMDNDRARARLADLKADSEYYGKYKLYIDAAIKGHY